MKPVWPQAGRSSWVRPFLAVHLELLTDGDRLGWAHGVVNVLPCVCNSAPIGLCGEGSAVGRLLLEAYYPSPVEALRLRARVRCSPPLLGFDSPSDLSVHHLHRQHIGPGPLAMTADPVGIPGRSTHRPPRAPRPSTAPRSHRGGSAGSRSSLVPGPPVLIVRCDCKGPRTPQREIRSSRRSGTGGGHRAACGRSRPHSSRSRRHPRAPPDAARGADTVRRGVHRPIGLRGRYARRGTIRCCLVPGRRASGGRP